MSAAQCRQAEQAAQAAQAVRLYLGMSGLPRPVPPDFPARPNLGATPNGSQPQSGTLKAPSPPDTLAVREAPPPGPLSPSRPAGSLAGGGAGSGPTASISDHPPINPRPDGGRAQQPGIPPPHGTAAPAPLPVTGASWVKELDALRDAMQRAGELGLLVVEDYLSRHQYLGEAASGTDES